MTKEKKRILILAGAAALLLCILVGGLVWFFTNHVFISGKFYPKDATMLNLRGRKLSLAEYDTLREKFPPRRRKIPLPRTWTRYCTSRRSTFQT